MITLTIEISREKIEIEQQMLNIRRIHLAMRLIVKSSSPIIKKEWVVIHWVEIIS